MYNHTLPPALYVLYKPFELSEREREIEENEKKKEEGEGEKVNLPNVNKSLQTKWFPFTFFGAFCIYIEAPWFSVVKKKKRKTTTQNGRAAPPCIPNVNWWCVCTPPMGPLFEILYIYNLYWCFPFLLFLSVFWFSKLSRKRCVHYRFATEERKMNDVALSLSLSCNTRIRYELTFLNGQRPPRHKFVSVFTVLSILLLLMFFELVFFHISSSFRRTLLKGVVRKWSQSTRKKKEGVVVNGLSWRS